MRESADLIGVGARALVDNARRLGLTWTLRLATVREEISTSQLQVVLDGDETPILVVSMIGSVPFNRRVYILSIPPAGNFAIGWVSRLFAGQRIATTTRTSVSVSFTTETQVDSVTANLVAGQTYRVVWHGRIQSTVADGFARARIRQGTSAGTILQLSQVPTTLAANQSVPLMMEVEFTPTVTGSQTFVTTFVRQAGTGTLSAHAATDTPTYMYVEVVS